MHPKRHHYVSQFYLARWTQTRSKNDKLIVTDVKTGGQRPGTPKGEANVKDLYTLEDSRDPLIVENEFSKIESHIAPLIQLIEEREALPDDPDEMDALLDWIALQRQKVLRMKEVYEGFYDQIARTMVQFATKSDQTFEQIKRGLGKDGESIAGASREDLLNLKFKVDSTTLVQHMLEGASVVADANRMRNWTLLIARKGVPEFITSDNPVVLVPMRAELQRVPLGFAMRDTCVLYPLTPRLAMSGTFDDQPPRAMVESDRVAVFNGLVAQAAERFVYSRRARFYHRAGLDIRWQYNLAR
jgi:hypothetical protein